VPSNIEWTDETWNPIAGCEAVSPGCAHCYAATMTRRLEAMGQKDYAGLTTAKHFNGKVRCLPDKLSIPLKWRKPRRVFVNSMSDLFHEDVPDEFIDRVFAVMAFCPRHTFQVLTKRAERMARYFNKREMRITFVGNAAIRMKLTDKDFRGPWPLKNVWLGVSAEDQQRADERIPWLLKTPAAVRFISAEPLLGPIDLAQSIVNRRRGDPDPNWVIVGGESGRNSRACRVEWGNDIMAQCTAAGVPAFRKQFGSVPLVDYYAEDDALREWALSLPHEILEPTSRGDYSVRAARDRYQPPPGTMIRVKLKDGKGGDPAEWPEDLRIRQMPEAAHA